MDLTDGEVYTISPLLFFLRKCGDRYMTKVSKSFKFQSKLYSARVIFP